MRGLNQIYMEFANRLFTEAARTHNGENTFISPFSAFVIMAMLERATAGRTREEITSLLGGEIVTDEMTKLISEIERSGSLSNANAFALNEKYLKHIDLMFAYKLKKMLPGTETFCQKNMTQYVNEWINAKTKGKINSILSSDTKVNVALLNAVVFHAMWQDAYEEHMILEDSDFTNSDGEIEKVTMLSSGEHIYIHSNGMSGFVKPYRGGEYEFMALLPDNPQMKLETFLENGIVGKIQDMYRSGRGANVLARIPEFKFSKGENLSEPLKRLGVKKVFAEEADMSPMLLRERGHVDGISQKVYVQVDRKGTEAVAVTCCGCEVHAAMPWKEIEYKKVYLDRPFLFAIMHQRTGLPVFVGSVNRIEIRNK